MGSRLQCPWRTPLTWRALLPIQETPASFPQGLGPQKKGRWASLRSSEAAPGKSQLLQSKMQEKIIQEAPKGQVVGEPPNLGYLHNPPVSVVYTEEAPPACQPGTPATAPPRPSPSQTPGASQRGEQS